MAGIMYSAYQLIWPGAPLFVLIIMIYAVFQYILNNLRKESSDYLGITGITTFLVSAILILPFVHPDMGFGIYYYSWFHAITAFGAIIGFVALSYIEKVFVKKRLNSYHYPLAVFGIAIVSLITVSIVAPSLYSTIINTPSTIFGIQTRWGFYSC